MSGISDIYFLDTKGKVIISRTYRGEVDQSVSDVIQKQVLELEEVNMKPIFTFEGVHYCWIKHLNIFIVALVRRNPNVCLIFAFLHKLVEILIEYLKSLEEESIRDNFVIIYELLDEVMDHGYPQITETNILKEFIKTNFYELHLKKSATLDISKTMTNVVSWRADGIFYKNNEAYLDVSERVNSIVSSSGVVLRSEVVGNVKMKSTLSGMPTLKLGLNDKVLYELSGKSANSNNSIDLDDFKFHQCVNMNKFAEERSIEFIPPDGTFDLMNYRLDIQLSPLFMVEVDIAESSSTRINFSVKIRSNFKQRTVSNIVDVTIPGPYDLLNPKFQNEYGNVNWLPDKQHFLWSMKNYKGQQEYYLKISFNVPTVRQDDTKHFLKTPIFVKFEIPYYTVSGIHVKYLKITEKSGYEAMPWVRYLTQNGVYQIRMI